jgi:hypothetical protein
MTYVIQRINYFHCKELTSSHLLCSLSRTLTINYGTPNTHTAFCYNQSHLNYHHNIHKFYFQVQHKAYISALLHVPATYTGHHLCFVTLRIKTQILHNISVNGKYVYTSNKYVLKCK